MNALNATTCRSTPDDNALFPNFPYSPLPLPDYSEFSREFGQDSDIYSITDSSPAASSSSYDSYPQDDIFLESYGYPAFDVAELETWSASDVTLSYQFSNNFVPLDLELPATSWVLLPESNWDMAPTNPEVPYFEPSITLLEPPAPAQPTRASRCDWLTCSNLKFFTPADYRVHTKWHARTVRSLWNPTSNNRCKWHGCTSLARFKTPRQFEDHISNIHINPLICTREHCKHKTPFRGKADLQRHIVSVHNSDTVRIKCPYKACDESEKGFSRKDKLVKHLRERHNGEKCPYMHCMNCMFVSEPEDLHSPLSATDWSSGSSSGSSGGSEDSEGGTARHIGKMHGDFECGIKSCAGTRSQFSEEGLLSHLQLHHCMRWEMVLKARDSVKGSGAKVLREDHVRGLGRVEDCGECRVGTMREGMLW